MALLSKDQLLSPKLPTQDVDVPELGGTVRIQQMSAMVRMKFLEDVRANRQLLDEYEENEAKPAKTRKVLTKPEPLDHAALALALSIVDEEGKLVFDPDDISKINSLPHLALHRIYAAMDKFNRFHEVASAAVEAEKKD